MQLKLVYSFGSSKSKQIQAVSNEWPLWRKKNGTLNISLKFSKALLSEK